jgi:hypothetical protein
MNSSNIPNRPFETCWANDIRFAQHPSRSQPGSLRLVRGFPDRASAGPPQLGQDLGAGVAACGARGIRVMALAATENGKIGNAKQGR